ncbi:MAG: cation:proton antiporter [Gammaproteobacteria bacterium]|nr:cation:proton antiporter [Gammaproteobacteria bacterium]MDH5650322.1 cation:proton antiporter [Gammaproteobacteria bacterium]
MQIAPQFFITIGCLLLLGLATDLLGRRTRLPRVTLLLIFGIVIGPAVLDLIPRPVLDNFELLANVALLMIGFLIGGRLTRKTFDGAAGALLIISATEVVVTAVVVCGVLLLLGMSPVPAILCACFASATDPAATMETINESGKKSVFHDRVLAVVALDDVWSLILFSVGLAMVGGMQHATAGLDSLIDATHEVGGAMLLGIVLGVPAAYLTGRIKAGQPMLTEALGLVLLCGGLAMWLDVSFLIAAIVMGAVITNLARHHSYPFHAIEGIEWPFMVVFFILAGASLKFEYVQYLGLIGVGYIIARMVGKVAGGGLGCWLSGADTIS